MRALDGSRAAPPLAQASLAQGYAFGACMALSAALTFTMTRAGVSAGLTAGDVALFRLAAPALILLPLVVRVGLGSLAGIGWGRGLLLAITGGAPFALCQASGFYFAPLAHGATITPAMTVVLGTAAGIVVLGERLKPAHVAGSCLLILGILIIGWDGLTASGGADAWIGDLLFVGASILWSVYTVLLRVWRIDPVRGVAVVSILSALAIAPLHAASGGISHLATLPWNVLLPQIVLQGIVGGLGAVIAYNQAVARLGVARAVLFPAIVPALTIIMGIALLGEWPSLTQATGLAVTSLGMLTAVGLLGMFWARRR